MGGGGPEPPESQAACWEGCPLTPQKPVRPVSQVPKAQGGNLTLQPAEGGRFLLLLNQRRLPLPNYPQQGIHPPQPRSH